MAEPTPSKRNWTLQQQALFNITGQYQGEGSGSKKQVSMVGQVQGYPNSRKSIGKPKIPSQEQFGQANSNQRCSVFKHSPYSGVSNIGVTNSKVAADKIIDLEDYLVDVKYNTLKDQKSSEEILGRSVKYIASSPTQGAMDFKRTSSLRNKNSPSKGPQIKDSYL